MQLNERGLYDIYEMYYIPFWQTNWFFWSILGLIVFFVCGIMLLFVRFWMRRKKIITPWHKALARLDGLVVVDTLSPQAAKHYYFILTEVMKTYMGERYQWDTTHLTDREFVEYIAQTPLDLVIKNTLADVCKSAEMIKFADQKTVTSILKEHIVSLRTIIGATTPDTKHQNKP
jgi:hypothetical protein